MYYYDPAVLFAIKAHADQIRKYSGEPYVLHCLRVAELASRYFVSDDSQRVAVLHDTIEDCGVSWETLSTLFGEHVANGVAALTNPSKQYKDLPRAERKAMDRKHLAEQGPTIITIKLCDRLDNLRELREDAAQAEAAAEFRTLYLEESRLLFNAVKGKAPERLERAFMEELLC